MIIASHFKNNYEFNIACADLGGLYNKKTNWYEFDFFMKDKVEEILQRFGGSTIEDRCVVEIGVVSYINYDSAVEFYGYPIVEDGKLVDGVYKISGGIDDDPNACKNQVADGTVFRLQVSKSLLNQDQLNENVCGDPLFTYKMLKGEACE